MHVRQLFSEVALAVGFKEEVSWQKEEIEGPVRFPPINNPVFMLPNPRRECLQPGQIFGELPNMEAVIHEAPRPSPQ